MRSDPGLRTYDKECVRRDRLLQGAEPEGTETAAGVFIELWEDERDPDGKRTWAVAFLDDARAHLGEGIRIEIGDDVAGWLQRNYGEEAADE